MLYNVNMPLPKSGQVGKIMHFLKKDKPGMPSKQKVAISLSQARKHGADIPQQAVKKATAY